MARSAPARPALVAALVFVVLLGGTIPGLAVGAPAAGPAATGASEDGLVADAPLSVAGTSSEDTIELAQVLQLTPKRPGEITVTSRFAIPAGVVSLETRVPPNATVVAATGFEPAGATAYRWDGQTTTPTVTYRLPVNRTMRATGPIAGAGDYLFVDPGPWALVPVPRTPTSWRWTGDRTVTLARETTVEGPGAVGESMAFLGEHTEKRRTAHGQTVRLVVPAAADLAEPPDRILDSMTAAADTLRVGARDDTVFAVAAPTGPVRWAVRGFQTGDADLWVRDVERLDTADNVWLHEYVHTRQDYTATDETRWFTEASASYYAALFAHEQERIGFEAFRAALAAGTRAPDRDAVLADPATWHSVAPYTKGALVAGDLDRALRAATDRRRSLQDVLAGMNAREGPVTAAAFRSLVREHGGDDVAARADRFTHTAAVPPSWDRAAHDAAFGATPARIEYALPAPGDPAGYRVSGPYRNASVGGERPLRLVTGETLAVAVIVTNTGGSVGEYDVRLRVDDAVVAREQGGLGAGETRTLTVTHRFDTPGEYTLAVAAETATVRVQPPATPTVRDLSVVRTVDREDGRRAVALSATVVNDHDRPAAVDLVLSHNGTPLESRPISLGPGERRTVAFAEVVVGPGVHGFRVGDATVTVTVDPPTDPPRISVRGDGFGLAAAVVALLAVGVLRRHRR